MICTTRAVWNTMLIFFVLFVLLVPDAPSHSVSMICGAFPINGKLNPHGWDGDNYVARLAVGEGGVYGEFAPV